MVAIPAASCQDIEQTGLLELFDGLGYDALLSYVLFERTGQIDWCAGALIGWFPYDWNTAPVHADPVFH